MFAFIHSNLKYICFQIKKSSIRTVLIKVSMREFGHLKRKFCCMFPQSYLENTVRGTSKYSIFSTKKNEDMLGVILTRLHIKHNYKRSVLIMLRHI